MVTRFFPLSVVTRRINELLEPAINKQFWVKAEIASGRERGGAFYCDLVETDSGGRIVAKIACTIWQRDLSAIKELFRSKDMNLVLDNGTVVGVLCSLQFSPQYGLSLKVVDADPAFALGEMELKKQEIIKRLQMEGLFELNKQRFVPLLPMKIGFVTSSGSAAYNDFIHTLNASGFCFKVYQADAMMQGEQTERSVLKALAALGKLDVELIVIARGGGSKTDLSFLDNEAIARAIAGCPLPVWTGIGHEIDTSVLDYVANRSFKTPTAVAEELVARCVQMRRQLEEATGTLRTVWAYRLKIDREYLVRAITGLHQGPRKLLDVKSGNLREQAQKVRLRVNNRIAAEQLRLKGHRELLRIRPLSVVQTARERVASRRRNLEMQVRYVLSGSTQILSSLKKRFQPEKIRNLLSMERRNLAAKAAVLKASDPENALQRGFALVYRQDGKLIRSIQDIQEHDSLRTHVADGVVISDVIAKEAKP